MSNFLKKRIVISINTLGLQAWTLVVNLKDTKEGLKIDVEQARARPRPAPAGSRTHSHTPLTALRRVLGRPATTACRPPAHFCSPRLGSCTQRYSNSDPLYPNPLCPNPLYPTLQIIGAAQTGYDPDDPSRGAPPEAAQIVNDNLVHPMFEKFASGKEFERSLNCITRHVVEEFSMFRCVCVCVCVLRVHVCACVGVRGTGPRGAAPQPAADRPVGQWCLPQSVRVPLAALSNAPLPCARARRFFLPTVWNRFPHLQGMFALADTIGGAIPKCAAFRSPGADVCSALLPWPLLFALAWGTAGPEPRLRARRPPAGRRGACIQRRAEPGLSPPLCPAAPYSHIIYNDRLSHITTASLI